MLPCIKALAVTSSFFMIVAASGNKSTKAPACRYMPGDAGWPSEDDWEKLNKTIGGKLIRGVPLAQPCYGPGYDPTICTTLANEWNEQEPYVIDPVNIMSPYWKNNSCSPFGPDLGPTGTCTLGNVAQYAIKVTDAATVVAGLKFATKKNIRVTIKNTGHDQLGRSAGAGSLALWTNNLKDKSFFNYSSAHYTGPALRAGAGVQVQEAYEAASEHGLRVTGGSCPTVGLAGGWLPGGGHGPLTSAYGLGADNALEFEVVTANGTLLTATPTQNEDLYWALSGGGPGNYAVVLSVTVKAHADGPVAGSSFLIENSNPEAFWSAVRAWLKHLLVLDTIPGLKTIVDLTSEYFILNFATWPGATADDLTTALLPFLDELETLNISLSKNETNVFPTFLEHYNYFVGADPIPNDLSVNDRLIPRSLVKDDTKLQEFIDTVRAILGNHSDAEFIFLASNVTYKRIGGTEGFNSVLPAWRDSLFAMNYGLFLAENATWDTMRDNQATINGWQDGFRALTPGGGSYMNEATFDNSEYKWDYFGENYDKLLAIKNKYDAKHILWTHAAVGSDALRVADDGRLCFA
ncbi:6-hydroxy-D-nicotine oxidase protein [Rutstroemia sp. NJR-2017a WRK4]|nr:6-hydroxy-D-nicotine oxidase protein [Rutstroemia sp. NJR-2017a WRK4]